MDPVRPSQRVMRTIIGWKGAQWRLSEGTEGDWTWVTTGDWSGE